MLKIQVRDINIQMRLSPSPKNQYVIYTETCNGK